MFSFCHFHLHFLKKYIVILFIAKMGFHLDFDLDFHWDFHWDFHVASWHVSGLLAMLALLLKHKTA